MSAELFALLAATCFAGSQVTAKRGLVTTSVVGGVLISVSTALVVLAISVAFDPPQSVDVTAIAFFAGAGIAAPGISRWAATTGVHVLGPSIAVPITQGARPLLAVAGAIAFLDEALDPQRAIALFAIVAGGWELSRSRGEAQALGMGSLEGTLEDERSSRHFFRPGIAFPLVAGLAYATSDVLAKEGLRQLGDPSFGALVGIGTALLVWLVVVTVSSAVRERVHFGPHRGWLVLSGALAGLALLNLFNALDRGDVTLVSPIIATQPLAVFVLSRLLLRDLEKLHPSTVLAGTSIVIGTIVMSL